LWIPGIIQAKLEIGFYGLIHGFPATYFLAMGVLTIASAILWIAKDNHGKLLFLQLCLLISAIWLAPVIAGGAQPFLPVVQGDLGFIEYIVREGQFDPEALWQHNWPGGWLWWATMIEVTGLSMDGFAGFVRWIPFLWQLALLMPLLLFFRWTIGRVNPNYCWAALWLFYIANWVGTQNTGAQSFGVFLVFSILALFVLATAAHPKAMALGHRVGAILLLGASIVAHLLGSIVTVAVTAAFYVARRQWSSNLVVLAVVFLAAWSVYGAMSYFEWKLPNFFDQAFRLGTAAERGIAGPLAGNDSHAAVALIRIIFSAMFAILAVLGFLLRRRLGGTGSADRTVLAFAVGCALAALVVGTSYRHELFQRFFVFLLPAIAYFGVMLLNRRGTAAVLCLALLAAVPLSFIAHFGNQTMDYMTPAYAEGADFFHEKAVSGYVSGERPLGQIEDAESYVRKIELDELDWEGNRLTCAGAHWPAIPHYISTSSHDRAAYTFFRDEEWLVDRVESALAVTKDSNLVFANPDFTLHLHYEPPPWWRD
jgi:hypothetical protein